MAKVTMTTTVNPQTGAPINTFAIGNGDTIKAVVLRPKLCAGSYQVRQVNLSLTIPDGTVSTFTIPNASPVPIVDLNSRPAATMVVQQGGGVEEENWVEGINFIIGANSVLTFPDNFVGTNKVATISYTYYDPVANNLNYDVPVYPSNTKGVITMDGLNLIVWNEGILAQEVKAFDTSGTANGVVLALITDA
jgi:hypothetical protein